jgi:hypothetical protein
MTYIVPPERRDGFLWVTVNGDEFLLKRDELEKAVTLWTNRHTRPTEFIGLYDEVVYLIPRDFNALVDMPAIAVENKREFVLDYQKECAIEGYEPDGR